MRTFDFAPFYRSTVGFDRLFSMLDQLNGVESSAPTYPPYNIAADRRVRLSHLGRRRRLHRRRSFYRDKREQAGDPRQEAAERRPMARTCSIRASPLAPLSAASNSPSMSRSRAPASRTGSSTSTSCAKSQRR